LIFHGLKAEGRSSGQAEGLTLLKGNDQLMLPDLCIDKRRIEIKIWEVSPDS
jgi:hypothetical protein